MDALMREKTCWYYCTDSTLGATRTNGSKQPIVACPPTGTHPPATLSPFTNTSLPPPGIAPVAPDQLFDEQFTDVRTWTPFLAAYFPLGCVLALFRMVRRAALISNACEQSSSLACDPDPDHPMRPSPPPKTPPRRCGSAVSRSTCRHGATPPWSPPFWPSWA